MNKRLNKFDQHVKKALDKAALDMGLIGQFRLGKRHNYFQIVLPDGTVLKLAVYKTPACGAETYARDIVSGLRALVHRHLENKGLV